MWQARQSHTLRPLCLDALQQETSTNKIARLHWCVLCLTLVLWLANSYAGNVYAYAVIIHGWSNMCHDIAQVGRPNLRSLEVAWLLKCSKCCDMTLHQSVEMKGSNLGPSSSPCFPQLNRAKDSKDYVSLCLQHRSTLLRNNLLLPVGALVKKCRSYTLFAWCLLSWEHGFSWPIAVWLNLSFIHFIRSLATAAFQNIGSVNVGSPPRMSSFFFCMAEQELVRHLLQILTSTPSNADTCNRLH